MKVGEYLDAISARYRRGAVIWISPLIARERCETRIVVSILDVSVSRKIKAHLVLKTSRQDSISSVERAAFGLFSRVSGDEFLGRVLGESDVVLDESVDELIGRVELAKTESGSFVGLRREGIRSCQFIGLGQKMEERRAGMGEGKSENASSRWYREVTEP